MKIQGILDHIESKKSEYKRSDFFAFLHDPHESSTRKLAFAPHVAHFVLTFGDLCSHLLPEHPPADEWQRLVNLNSQEDKGHWRWYLADLATLGENDSRPYGEAIRVIWGDATLRTRLLSYGLVGLAHGASSLEKLILVHCIEGAFQATVADLGEVAATYQEQTGSRLQYLGNRHEEAESDHTLEQPEVQRAIAETEVDDAAYERLSTIVNECFGLFEQFADEMRELASKPVSASASSLAI